MTEAIAMGPRAPTKIDEQTVLPISLIRGIWAAICTVIVGAFFAGIKTNEMAMKVSYIEERTTKIENAFEALNDKLGQILSATETAFYEDFRWWVKEFERVNKSKYPDAVWPDPRPPRKR